MLVNCGLLHVNNMHIVEIAHISSNHVDDDVLDSSFTSKFLFKEQKKHAPQEEELKHVNKSALLNNLNSSDMHMTDY